MLAAFSNFVSTYKRKIQHLERVLSVVGIEPLILRITDRCFSYPDLDKNECVSRTLYRVMLVNFRDFGIFDRKQYCQGPKYKLLENSRLWPAIFRGTPGNFEA